MKMDWPPEVNEENKKTEDSFSQENPEGVENIVVNKIKTSTPEEFKELVEDFSRVVDKNKSLGNSIIKETFSKYFSLFKNVKNYKGEEIPIERPYSKSTSSFNDTFERDILLNTFSDSSSQPEEDEDTFNEKVYKIVMNLAHQYPAQVESMWELFWQTHGETSRMNVLIDGMLDLVKDKKCSSLVNRVNFDMQYFYSFSNKEETEKTITEKLDFDKEENFGRTFAMLELLKRSFGNLDGYAENRGVGRLIVKIIKNSLNKPGSYLLKSKAEETLNLLEKGKQEKYETPFKISRNEFAFFDKTGLKIIDQETYNKKTELLGKYKSVNQELYQKTINMGGEYTLNNNESKLLEGLQEGIWGTAGRNLKVNDIVFDKEKIKNEDEILFDFEYLQKRQVREKIERDFNLSLGEFTLEEQFQFLNFLKAKNNEEFKRTERNIKMFGAPMAKTFLSIEQGGKEMGDKIISLGEKLPEEVVQKVFAKYGEIIDTADNTHKILEDILPKEVVSGTQKEINEIKESMLNRAKDLLCTFYDKKDNNSEQLLRDLERYKSEILLYADTYKKLKDLGKEIHLEDIKNTEITVLSQEEKEKIAKNLWNITKANRPFIKEGTEEMISREKNFNLTIENKNSNFYVLKHKNEIVAFCSVTPDENNDLYLESLNTESEVKGSQIGGAFLPVILERMKDLGKNIYGHVHVLNSGTLPYYERLGFKIQEIKEGGELKYYEIKIPASQEFKKAA